MRLVELTIRGLRSRRDVRSFVRAVKRIPVVGKVNISRRAGTGLAEIEIDPIQLSPRRVIEAIKAMRYELEQASDRTTETAPQNRRAGFQPASPYIVFKWRVQQMSEPKRVLCPECEGEVDVGQVSNLPVDRRDFLRTVSGAAIAAAGASALPAFPAQAGAAQKTTAPAETAVKRLYDSLTAERPKDAKRPGICVCELSKDQQQLVAAVLSDILAPYRESDREAAMTHLKAGGGLSQLNIAFYQEGDIGDDSVWDIWRLEGPTVVCHFRGSPHIHAYINIAAPTS